MSDLLQEYKAYYSTRAERFAGNEKYKHSYEAEKAVSDAMQSCSALEEFKEKLGDKNERCAVALTKDHAIMDEAHFEKHQEIVRILGPQRILEQVDSCKTALDVTNLITDLLNKNSIEISMDEAHREFIYDWFQIDNYIMYKNAVVPDQYKSRLEGWCNEIVQSMQRGVEGAEKNNHEWEAGWRLIPEKNLEYRHRRLLPFSDEHIQEQIQLYKTLVNR
ncbi:MAG: hypothetical protein C0592_04295 [Marinilabiliales bacterium]|nr:MAG: hypothetical protein C0592_04295 [Marinilabiliales bacterium]